MTSPLPRRQKKDPWPFSKAMAFYHAADMARRGLGYEDIMVKTGLSEDEARKIVGLPERKVRT